MSSEPQRPDGHVAGQLRGPAPSPQAPPLRRAPSDAPLHSPCQTRPLPTRPSSLEKRLFQSRPRNRPRLVSKATGRPSDGCPRELPGFTSALPTVRTAPSPGRSPPLRRAQRSSDDSNNWLHVFPGSGLSLAPRAGSASRSGSGKPLLRAHGLGPSPRKHRPFLSHIVCLSPPERGLQRPPPVQTRGLAPILGGGRHP